MKYFFSVPVAWDPELMLTVFSDYSPAFCFLEGNAGRVLHAGGVEALFHLDVERSQESQPWDSMLTPHPIVLGEPMPDVVSDVDVEAVPYDDHKLGGVPHLTAQVGKLRDEVDALMARGFRQVVQINFPGGEDAAVAGDWPFATGMFHVLAVKTNTGLEWRCFWER